MVETDILDMLAEISQSATARLSPVVTLPGESAEIRRRGILRAIRGTVLPRRLEFTAGNGDVLALEVGSSRVTDVFEASVGALPDFETEAREDIIVKLAELVSAISAAPAPLQLVSQHPDASPDADDVGITLGEIERACAALPLPAEPHVAVVADNAEPEAAEEPASDTLARAFFDGADRFATGRVLIDARTLDRVEADGLCAQGQPLCPDAGVLAQFARDLAGWDADSAATLSQPQLIVLRPSGGKATALAVLRDGDLTAAAVHEARKLGAVVNLWKSLAGEGQ
ncbi:hypothetical protein FGK63_16220 [Ruegeria sediminis]|uniref:Uncharacterized protein n=1 Tax=Ruegeria sediminis TaxID=2583820 RepID=A0ABY2WUZ3_9RHOB|nr:hypothetical protein [Ruegeria sediminis]TMV05589.1 hypothetical protein FGK63_16220 [Ruegeria sediminis]